MQITRSRSLAGRRPALARGLATAQSGRQPIETTFPVVRGANRLRVVLTPARTINYSA